jgi:hypothetical protein
MALRDPEEHEERAPGFSWGLFFTIFGLILGAATFLLIDQIIESVYLGVGFLIAALAFSAVLCQIIGFWHDRTTRWYVVSVVVLYGIVNLLIWLISSKDIDVAALERRVSQLERENEDLRQQVQRDKDNNTLLSFVGEDIQRTCRIYVSNTYFADEEASIDCRPPDLINFELAIYSDIPKMDESYLNTIQTVRGIPEGNVENCRDNKPTLGEWQSTNSKGQRNSGRLLCYVDSDNDSWVEWTDNTHKIYAFAIREGKDIGALYEWWSRSWSTKE